MRARSAHQQKPVPRQCWSGWYRHEEHHRCQSATAMSATERSPYQSVECPNRRQCGQPTGSGNPVSGPHRRAADALPASRSNPTRFAGTPTVREQHLVAIHVARTARPPPESANARQPAAACPNRQPPARHRRSTPGQAYSRHHQAGRGSGHVPSARTFVDTRPPRQRQPWTSCQPALDITCPNQRPV